MDLTLGSPLLQGKTKDELNEWPVSSSTMSSFFANTSAKITPKEWHNRLGHPTAHVLNSIISSFSLPCSQAGSQNLSCSDCSINKSHKLPFPQTSITSKRPLEYMFADVWTSPIVPVDNFKYYLVIYHYTRYTWLYVLKRKSDLQAVFVPFKALDENKFQSKICTFFSDNGASLLLSGPSSLHLESHILLHLHTLHNIIESLKENIDIWLRQVSLSWHMMVCRFPIGLMHSLLQPTW